MHYYFINLVILNYKILLTRDFCERNEGVLFSAFVSLIIILISVFGTYYFTNKSNNNKNRDKYTGLIQIIKTELVWNIINLNNLSKTLLVLKQRSIEAKSIVISDVNFKFDTSILESSLLNIIEYKKFN